MDENKCSCSGDDEITTIFINDLGDKRLMVENVKSSYCAFVITQINQDEFSIFLKTVVCMLQRKQFALPIIDISNPVYVSGFTTIATPDKSPTKLKEMIMDVVFDSFCTSFYCTDVFIWKIPSNCTSSAKIKDKIVKKLTKKSDFDGVVLSDTIIKTDVDNDVNCSDICGLPGCIINNTLINNCENPIFKWVFRKIVHVPNINLKNMSLMKIAKCIMDSILLDNLSQSEENRYIKNYYYKIRSTLMDDLTLILNIMLLAKKKNFKLFIKNYVKCINSLKLSLQSKISLIGFCPFGDVYNKKNNI